MTTDQELGQLVLDTIIEGALVRADSEGLLVWSGNAQEQIGAAIKNATPQHCPRCKSEEWFPGAACWHCGWEAGPSTLESAARAVVDEAEKDRDGNDKLYDALDALAAALPKGPRDDEH